MKKYIYIVSLLLLSFGFLFTLNSSKSVSAAAVGAGPTGNNGLHAFPGPGVGQETLSQQPLLVMAKYV